MNRRRTDPGNAGAGRPRWRSCTPLSVAAPPRLVADTRVEFRALTLDRLAGLAAEGVPALEIDLARTTEVDASGLGMLVLIQKRARDAGVSTRLVHANEQLRALLALTRLDTLFELQ